MDGRHPARERRAQDPAYMVDSSAAHRPVCATAGARSADVGDYACMTGREPAGKFWFCMEHRRVESSEETHGSDHLGPFPTVDAAAHALETVAEREKAYDAEDSEYNGDD
jgi:hypothetical protein